MNKTHLSLLSTCCLLSLFANPENGIVIEGNASFERGASELVVWSSDRAIIHWDSFSIDANEITRFVQGGTDAAVLNRVTGEQMSRLMGTLSADGKVFLINPNGVIVGKEGMIDAGSFIASSFDISNDAFLSGEDFTVEGNSLRPIVNEGTIRAKNGDVFIFASRIENHGAISAPLGDACLGAGQRILVGIQGKKSLYVDVSGDGISNEGSIEALNAFFAANANPYSLGLQNKGIVHAHKLEASGGEIYLRCKGSSLENRGQLLAPNGTIQIEAENALFENRSLIEGGEGSISIAAFSERTALSDQRPVVNYGKISAETIKVNAPKFSTEGSILAGDGSIAIFVPGTYLEMPNSTIRGHEIKVIAGNYFTSGEIVAKEGSIEIETERFLSSGGRFDASGEKQGGRIKIAASSLIEPISLSRHAVINVSGQEIGGSVELISSLPVHSKAAMNIDGKVSGSLSVPSLFSSNERLQFVDPNPEMEPLLWSAVKELREQNRLLPDDFQLASICPPSGYEFIDPNPTGTNSSFGDAMVALSSGNVVVTKSNDSFNGAQSGAVYLYNASTGGLPLSILRGSQAGDLVGSGGVTKLSNGNYVVSSPRWGNGTATSAGAATWGSGIAGVGGSAVVSANNSLVGTQLNDQVSGNKVFALTNGNYVVASPRWRNLETGATNAGAATWGDGVNGTTGSVSTANSLVGTFTSDSVANSIAPLTNGNFVVKSGNWHNAGIANSGASTWGNGLTGRDGTGNFGAVSPANSLVGTHSGDSVGAFILALTNGNYVLTSQSWTNQVTGAANAGAATWGNGTTGQDLNGSFGAVSPNNSLVGTKASDLVAFGFGVIPLANGNYVVSSYFWRNFATGAANAGAATWGNGSTGTAGDVSLTNSLVGTSSGDRVGTVIYPLLNNNYVVAAPSWSDGLISSVGAATWCNGLTGTVGEVSSNNSLVGTTVSDSCGTQVLALTNGHYVVGSRAWTNTAFGSGSAGAVTWCDGTVGNVGTVSSTNSLVGTQVYDSVGSNLYQLTNGNYVAQTANWNNVATGVANAGAVSWGNGAGGTVGEVSITNSFIGTTAFDQIGRFGIFPLANGNYVFSSQDWNNTLGAVTWGNGLGGSMGNVGALNSLIGSTVLDFSGAMITPLANSNYVVNTPSWDNGSAVDAGAVTWCNGLGGTVGIVNPTTSIVGSQSGDMVGDQAILEFSPQQYLITSSMWSDGSVAQIGALTLADNTSGAFCDGGYGAVSSANSFLGSGALDVLSNFLVVNGPAGNFAVVQFLDDPGETRIFSFPHADIPVPSIPASGIHDFAIAVTEFFEQWEMDWLFMKDTVNASDLYPPLGTYKRLQQMYPSLTELTKE